MTTTTDALPTQSATRRAVPSFLQIVTLMNLVSGAVEIAEIEYHLTADAVISYRLMTYPNSAAMGLPREIKSFRQVIIILGYDQLYRWMTMLLVTADPHARRSSIGLDAIIRGRFMELMISKHYGHLVQDHVRAKLARVKVL